MGSSIPDKSDTSLRQAKERLDVDQTTDRLQAVLHNQRFEFVLKQFNHAQSVLEIGTGVGSFSPVLAAHCNEYTGIEFDAESAKAASQRLVGNARVIEGDARNLPFEPGRFSVIVCLEVLEHLGDWVAGVNGIQKCLQDKGVAVISVPYRKRGGKNPSNPYHLYEPGESELTACLKQRFGEVSVFYQYFQETSLMTLARIFHMRRLCGLHTLYSVLSTGEPQAVSRLKIESKAQGMKLHWLAVLKNPRPVEAGS